MTLQTYWRITANCTKFTCCRCVHDGIEIYAKAFCLLSRKEKDIEIRLAYYNMRTDTLTVYATDTGMKNYVRSVENERPKR